MIFGIIILSGVPLMLLVADRQDRPIAWAMIVLAVFSIVIAVAV
jgi:hypothetical protein